MVRPTLIVVLAAAAFTSAATARQPADVGLAYSRDRSGDFGDGDLWVARADGSGARRLLGWRGSTEAEPSWSPDGERLVFSRDFDPPVGTHVDLYVASLAGGTPRRITSGPRTVAEHSPTWSPDGRTIAFERQDGNARGLGVYTVRPDGRGLRRLTRGEDHDPSWSPDGRHIAVSGGPISVVDARSGKRRRLTRPRGTPDVDVDDHQPDWSPDGRRIVFRRIESPLRGGGVDSLWLVDADGRNERRLYIDGAAIENPDWSPDGRWIAFVDGTDVAVVDAHGKRFRRLTRTPAVNEADPAWRPRR